jgi:3-hydroxyacyl-CoA dehydrogenase
MNYRKVGVIGAGAMGAGITQAMASSSREVVLVDITTDFVNNGLNRIYSGLDAVVRKGGLTVEEKTSVLSRIRGSIDQEQVADADLVIEAIVEDREAKGRLFRNLNVICSPQTVFATNTSTLSVTDLAFLSGRSARFLGLHFFNPVHAMKLVEVIPGLDTENNVLDDARVLVESLNKVPIVVRDCPGFLVNRIHLSQTNEAMLFAQEGISPEVIDAAARKAGFAMGPMQLADMVGLDVDSHTWPILHRAYGDRFPVPVLSHRLCEAGRLGAKSGKGIYNGGAIDEEFNRIVNGIPAGSYEGRRDFSVESLILREVNEAVYCLQEGVASAQAIDRAMLLGTSFPSRGGVGGPLHWADEKGLDSVVSALEDLTESAGERFRPHYLLKSYVAAGRLGRKTGRGFFMYGD